MVAELCREAPEIGVVVMDAHSLAAAEDTFDMAIAAFVAHVVESPSAVVHDMARVVRPGGRVVLCLPGPPDPRWTGFFNLFGRFAPRVDAQRIAQPVIADDLLTSAGLHDLERWTVTAELPVASAEAVWEHEMTHGFAGYVASLEPDDRRAFRAAVLEELRTMETAGPIAYVRTAAVTTGYVGQQRRD
jgi:SAM-dependent methyltransferase